MRTYRRLEATLTPRRELSTVPCDLYLCNNNENIVIFKSDIFFPESGAIN